jgi:serine protease Do
MTLTLLLTIAPVLVAVAPSRRKVAAAAQSPTEAEKAWPSTSLAPLIDSVKAAVVNVDVRVRRNADGQKDEQDITDEQLERYFGVHTTAPKHRLERALGSGFLIDPRGLVVTNHHVIEAAVIIRVRLEDGRIFDADVIGRDPLTDVALLSLRSAPPGLPALKLGDSSTVKVGDFSVAIGNPYGLASSVSLGIISALDRDIHAGPYDQFLQTDAAINPGNSGGPLFNLKGEVIGINTAIVGNATGLGFAVPSNVVKTVLPQLERTGGVIRGWLGAGIQDLDPTLSKALNVPLQEGAVILAVSDNSPAKISGLAPDDVVVALDGAKVTTGSGLSRAVALHAPNEVVKLSVYRGGKLFEASARLAVRPDIEGHEKRAAPTEAPSNARVGLGFQDIDPRLAEAVELPTWGALIVDVVPGSPAERVGLRRGMVVVEAGHQAVRDRQDLTNVLTGARQGTVLLVRVMLPNRGRALFGLELP